jgi:hypothetical protein
VMSDCCVASETPSLNVTMYETGGPVGAGAVVVESVEVVTGEVSVAVVSVVAVSVEVEAESVVAGVVSVLEEDAPVPLEVESVLVVVSVLLAPVKTLVTPPSGSLGSAIAPEANTPSTSRARRPNPILNPFPLRRMTPTSPGYDRPSLARPKQRKRTGCVPVGQVKLVLISCPQLFLSHCHSPAGHPSLRGLERTQGADRPNLAGPVGPCAADLTCNARSFVLRST